MSPGKLLPHALYSSLRHTFHEPFVREHPENAPGERPRVGLYEPSRASMFDDLRDTADTGCNDGFSRGHCLHRDDSHWLNAGRKHEQSRPAEQRRELGPANRSDQEREPFQTAIPDSLLEHRHVFAVTRDHEFEIRTL